MLKRKYALAIVICLCLIVSIFCGCNIADTSADTYKLTVEDPSGYLIDDLQEEYKEGVEVIVHIRPLPEGDLAAYLDNTILGLESPACQCAKQYGEDCWEYYFKMPSHDATLSFAIPQGLTKQGLILDGEIYNEIKIAAYDTFTAAKWDPSEELYFNCYGVFDNVYVAIFFDIASSVMDGDSETVAGLWFDYPSGWPMFAYCDGAFYRLDEAYENGILSYENLMTVQQTYKVCEPYFYRNK